MPSVKPLIRTPLPNFSLFPTYDPSHSSVAMVTGYIVSLDKQRFPAVSSMSPVSATAADVETTLTLPASPRLILLGMHFIDRHIIYQIGHCSLSLQCLRKVEPGKSLLDDG
ncbi:hypothetical protein F7725_016236 [Dissostichus mawsoni]|uniref:Uncharacterized protein n=1 Tax=Dissostichus mawsoni TaxID=36200 RepID=A0A7J5Z218_DISMA|nr:hypothetical protein F7725_016236 [Dissostichus mawsoni]